MEIQKCSVCNSILYPGEKRYQVKILIYPEEEELFDGELPEEEGTDPFVDEDNACDALSMEPHCNEDACGEDLAHEIYFTLCKNCQTRFLNNPSVEANLMFLNWDPLVKIVH
jgi:hypothetical protein